MCKYLLKVIADFPEEITGVSATPAADHLYKVREDGRGRYIPPHSISAIVCGKQRTELTKIFRPRHHSP